MMEENKQIRPSLGALVALAAHDAGSGLAPAVDANVIVQLLSIRDNHPQWRHFRREDGVIAAHKYAAQLKPFSAPHKITIL